MGPLTDLLVVSLEQAVAAPLCSARLARAGARVIKVERPEGDFARFYDSAVAGHSSYFVWLNVGKESVVLDLREAAGQQHLQTLLRRCDVFVQNLKPGVLPRIGVDLSALHAARPELISVSISGFHPSGPGAQRKAYDLLMQAESGLADITGSPHAAGRVGVSMVDIATGMFAYEAVLEALLARGIRGTGDRIDVSLFDAVAQWLAVPYLLDRYAGAAPARVGLAHPGICPYGVFETADGVSFILSVQNEAEWQRLCASHAQLTPLATDSRCINNETRVANRTVVDDALQAVFAAQPYAAVDKQLAGADLAYAPVNPISALKTHPDFRTQQVRVGPQHIELPAVPGLDGLGPQAQPEVPALGAHTDAVLHWLDSTPDT